MHLIFDLDGTLADSLPGILFSIREAIRQVLHDPMPEKLDFSIVGPVREILQKTLRISSQSTLDMLEAAFRISYDSEGWKMSQLYPGVLETLQQFRSLGIPLYIVTNKPRIPTGFILNCLGLSQLFLDVVCPDSRQPRFEGKGDCLYFLLDKYTLKKEQSVYVGDSQDDLFISDRYGITFVGVEYGYGSFRDLPRPLHLIYTFPELFAGLSTWFPIDDCLHPFGGMK